MRSRCGCGHRCFRRWRQRYHNASERKWSSKHYWEHVHKLQSDSQVVCSRESRCFPRECCKRFCLLEHQWYDVVGVCKMTSVADEIAKYYVTLSWCMFHVVSIVICANVLVYNDIRILCLFCDNILFVPWIFAPIDVNICFTLFHCCIYCHLLCSTIIFCDHCINFCSYRNNIKIIIATGFILSIMWPCCVCVQGSSKNGIILLIFRIGKSQDIHFVGNLFLSTRCELYYGAVITVPSLPLWSLNTDS